MPIDIAGLSSAPGAARLRAHQTWAVAGREPGLEEILSEPMVRLVMCRDGVTEAQLRRVIAAAQAKLSGTLCCRPAA